MKEKVAIYAVLANMVLAGGKITVGLFSNSAAILAEGIHSFMDIFSSAIGYLGIRISRKPEDSKHPYGYYKFEVLGGTLITVLLLVAGLLIVWEAYRNFMDPKEVIVSWLALGVMIFSALVNEAMARLKIHFGKKENSIALISDGVHSRVDVFASLAVLGGLLLTDYWIYADSVLALFVGLYIIKESFSLGKEAVDSLLDVSAGEEIEKEIREITKLQGIELESLKTQKKGSVLVANLEVRIQSGLSVEEASDISKKLREKLMEKIESLRYVSIQILSHEVQTGYYRPKFGQGLSWQKKGEALGRGPEGECICSSCEYTMPHKRGIPCAEIKCPKCGKEMKRK